MVSIGVRVEPKKIHYSVFDSLEGDFVTVDNVTVPLVLSVPDRLKYIRSNLIDLLEEYNIDKAGIRVVENNVRNPSVDRLYIEGILIEALASRKNIVLTTFVLSQIAKVHSSDIKTIQKIIGKKHLELQVNSFNYDVSDYDGKEIEAMLVGKGVAL